MKSKFTPTDFGKNPLERIVELFASNELHRKYEIDSVKLGKESGLYLILKKEKHEKYVAELRQHPTLPGSDPFAFVGDKSKYARTAIDKITQYATEKGYELTGNKMENLKLTKEGEGEINIEFSPTVRIEANSYQTAVNMHEIISRLGIELPDQFELNQKTNASAVAKFIFCRVPRGLRSIGRETYQAIRYYDN
jgi:hypothetical protein